MKKIDAHAHLGYIGGWANVGMDVDELISLMDTYEIETTMICVLVMKKHIRLCRNIQDVLKGVSM